MLETLTLVLIAVVVLALAGYLILIALALRGASRSVAAIADGLERISDHATPLPEYLATVNAALGKLLSGLQAADAHLARAARVFKLQ